MNRSTVRITAVTAGLAAVAAVSVAVPAVAAGGVVRAADELVPLTAGSALVPEGARGRVQLVPTPDGGTRVTLHVQGLAADRSYGAHAHVAGCAIGGGGHFQHVPGGTVDAVNEIWLDLTTNAAGNGHSSAVQDWQISPDRAPQSVIIHVRATDANGLAGTKLAGLELTS